MSQVLVATYLVDSTYSGITTEQVCSQRLSFIASIVQYCTYHHQNVALLTERLSSKHLGIPRPKPESTAKVALRHDGPRVHSFCIAIVCDLSRSCLWFSLAGHVGLYSRRCDKSVECLRGTVRRSTSLCLTFWEFVTACSPIK